jgi:glutathione synthase
VQQEWTIPRVLGRYLSPLQYKEIRTTITPVYPLNSSELGLHAQKLARNAETAKMYILKPNLVGGGYNIYGDDIPECFEIVSEEELSSFLLGEHIDAPTNEGTSMGSKGMDR